MLHKHIWLKLSFNVVLCCFSVLLKVRKTLKGPLRSSGFCLFSVWVQTKHGDVAFSFYAPYISQKALELKHAETRSSFESRLKSRLFSAAFPKVYICTVILPLFIMDLISNVSLTPLKCLLNVLRNFFNVLNKAIWILFVHEMCYINTLASTQRPKRLISTTKVSIWSVCFGHDLVITSPK